MANYWRNLVNMEIEHLRPTYVNNLAKWGIDFGSCGRFLSLICLCPSLITLPTIICESFLCENSPSSVTKWIPLAFGIFHFVEAKFLFEEGDSDISHILRLGNSFYNDLSHSGLWNRLITCSRRRFCSIAGFCGRSNVWLLFLHHRTLMPQWRGRWRPRLKYFGSLAYNGERNLLVDIEAWALVGPWVNHYKWLRRAELGKGRIPVLMWLIAI